MPFSKGDPNINRNGRPVNPEIKMLREALDKEGLKRGVLFWEKVAEKAFTDNNIMISVLKKFIPDTTFMSVEGDTKGPTQIVIVRSKEEIADTAETLPRQVPVQP